MLSKKNFHFSHTYVEPKSLWTRQQVSNLLNTLIVVLTSLRGWNITVVRNSLTYRRGCWRRSSGQFRCLLDVAVRLFRWNTRLKFRREPLAIIAAVTIRSSIQAKIEVLAGNPTGDVRIIRTYTNFIVASAFGSYGRYRYHQQSQ